MSKRAVSCVGALAVRSSEAPRLFERFDRLRDRWGLAEVKGGELSEKQFKEVVSVCRRFDTLLEVRAIDVNLQTPAEIVAYKKEQGGRLVRDLTSAHPPEFHVLMADRRRYLEGLPDQLFVQIMLLVTLIDDVLREAIPYYAFRRPEELGSFRWRVDAKDTRVTEVEKLWEMLLLPMLQSASVRQPHEYPEEGDYSHFEKFDEAEDPDYLKEYAQLYGINTDGRSRTNLTKVVRGDFQLCDSKSELGLQLVDVLVAAVRRAMMGTLKREGWGDIGRLMTSRPTMSVLEVPGSGARFGGLPIRDANINAVLDEIEKTRKSLIPSRFSRGVPVTLKR